MTATEVLVVGAGYVGSRLLQRLPAGSAWGLRRGPSDDTRQRMLEVDLDRDVPDLPAAQTIVYTVPPARSETDPRLPRLLNAIKVMPKRFVYFSTTGVYGDRGGARVAEDAELNPTTPRAQRRVAAEKLLQQWCDLRDVELTILRVPGIYGPGRLRLDRIREGEAILREQDAGPANRIHVDDLVTCTLAALDPGRPAGIYNVGDGDERNSSWFTKTVAELAGLEQPPEISLAAAEREFSDMRLSFLKESRRCDVRRMREVLRVELAYPDARDGIRASLPENLATADEHPR
ncbi:MAG: NAD-dependent epimerase/dehydratase family protein [Woeseia sp.]